MATFLLIGPSGVGKSSACEIVARKSDIKVFDLDKVLKEKIGGNSLSNHLSKIGNEDFFNFSKSAIQEIEAYSKLDTIIVVGAGSINFNSRHEWYLEQKLITLIGEEEVIYERGNRKQYHPTLDSFVKTEFNPSRKHLYQHSQKCIDVTQMTLEEIAETLIKIIKNHP